MESAESAERSSVPCAKLFETPQRYAARYPSPSEAKVSSAAKDNAVTVGKAWYVTPLKVRFSPKDEQSFSIIDFIRGILLFCEIIKEKRFSFKSCPSMRIPFPDSAARLKISIPKDFAALTTLPENPTHEGLIAQGWNWNLADAKAYARKYPKMWIG